MKKLLVILVVIAIAIASVITINNVRNSEWKVAIVIAHDIFDSKAPNWVYSVKTETGAETNVISSKQWVDGDVIKVLVKTCKNGEIKGIRAKNLTKSELEDYNNNLAKADYESVIEISKQHLEFCKTTNSLNERFASSEAANEAISAIMDKYPNGFNEYSFFGYVEEAAFDIALISADYLF